MSRTTSINVNVNSGKSIATISKLKESFIELNKAKEKLGKDGKITLNIDLKGFDKNTLDSIAKSLNKVSSGMRKLTDTSKEFKDIGGVINTTVNNTTNNIYKAKKETDSFDTSLGKTGKTLIGTSIAFGVLSNKIKNYLTTYSQLTSSTFNVGIASQMSIAQIDHLNESFLKLSTTVPSTAKEMAESVDALIRTGRSFEESRKIIEQVAILSTASGDSLKDTSAVVTKVMVSLGVGADKVKETLTTMHSTAIQTASDMGYLAEGFKNVAGTASVLVKQSGLSGKELEDYKQKILDVTMASIGSMANLGLSASYLQ